MDDLVDLLLYAVLSDESSDLSAFERLYVTYHAREGREIHRLHLRELYIACGCYEEALVLCQAEGHYRKLGDLAWAAGNLREAQGFYLHGKVETPNGYIREGPDWDRLIKLAFCGGQWDAVIRLFLEAPFERLGQVGNSRHKLKGWEARIYQERSCWVSPLSRASRSLTSSQSRCTKRANVRGPMSAQSCSRCSVSLMRMWTVSLPLHPR